MAQTIVGLYDSHETARAVLRDLEAAGFGDHHLRMTSHKHGTDNSYYRDPNDLRPSTLREYGIPEDEADFYGEGVRRGGTLIVVHAHDDDAEKAAAIMARYASVDYETRLADYREQGWTGYDETASAYTDEETRSERERYGMTGQDEVIKVVEEDLQVGKREVTRGGVRVHTYVDEESVEETLRLREEHVHVDRRTVDEKVSGSALEDAFQERTIEMTERAEVPVVNKEARVVEEVVVGKDVDQRTEVIQDTIRKLRVDIDKEVEGYANFRDDFRNHFKTTYGADDDAFDTYEPAYRYGYTMADDNDFSGRSYDEAEGDLRQRFNSRYGEGRYGNVRDAVRYGYNQRYRSRATA